MNTDEGRFEIVCGDEPTFRKLIQVGEVHKINGEACEVTKIGSREITLKLMSSHDRLMDELAATDALLDSHASIVKGYDKKRDGKKGRRPNSR